MSECFGIMSIPPSASIVSWAPIKVGPPLANPAYAHAVVLTLYVNE